MRAHPPSHGFAERQRWTCAGTGEWAGATGVLRVDGTFDGSTVVGEYAADICDALGFALLDPSPPGPTTLGD